jgi:hypothetical protein
MQSPESVREHRARNSVVLRFEILCANLSVLCVSAVNEFGLITHRRDAENAETTQRKIGIRAPLAGHTGWFRPSVLGIILHVPFNNPDQTP